MEQVVFQQFHSEAFVTKSAVHVKYVYHSEVEPCSEGI